MVEKIKRLMTTLKCLLVCMSFIFSVTACNKEKAGSDKESQQTSVESGGESRGEALAPAADANTTVRVITANIAAPTNFESSYIKYKGQTPEDYRMKKRFVRLCTLVDYFSPDVLMLQEVNGRGGWWDYLITNEDSLLNRFPKYSFVGNMNLAGGKDGNGNAGTFYNQVYYNTTKFDLVAGGTFFCRDDKTSPENKYSGDYEGVYSPTNTTTCSWAVLRDKKTNVTAVYASTHLCTRPSDAQCFRNYGQARNATEGLYAVAEEYKWGSEALPIVLAGDFNGDPSHSKFLSYPHMTENAHYADSKLLAPVEDNSGTARVFGKDITNNGIRIDYVFHQGASVTDYRVLQGTFIEDSDQTYCEYNPEPVLDGSQYDLTDHLPVYVKLKMTGSGSSVAPDDYVNPEILDDEVITEGTGLNVTRTKLVFDSPDILEYVGKNEKKGFEAAVVFDGISPNFCLRLSMPKSRIDPVISIDYGALMTHLGLTPVKADECKKIKVEYRLSVTKAYSSVHFGGSTTGMVPISIGTNTVDMPAYGGEWNTMTFDFTSIDSNFWSGDFTYLGFGSGIGLMAGDAVYVKSIEFMV